MCVYWFFFFLFLFATVKVNKVVQYRHQIHNTTSNVATTQLNSFHAKLKPHLTVCGDISV